MSVNTQEQIGSISALIAKLRENATHDILSALAREMTNHVFLTARFGLSATGELRAQDVQMILDRWELVLRTIQQSEPGPEAFRQGNGGPRVRPVDMARLETDIRAPAGNRG
jgi:hypothetical protein